MSRLNKGEDMSESIHDEARRAQLCQELERVDGIRPSKNSAIPKHRIMANNPFRFLRGAASLFYADIQSGLIALPQALNNQNLNTFIMGDCHISNFGFFSEEGSHGDTIIFAPNDFDDACIGSASWDLLRYLTSLHLTHYYCHQVYRGEVESDEVEVASVESVVGDAVLSESLQIFLEQYVSTCQKLIQGMLTRHHVLEGFGKKHPLRKLEKKALKRAAGGKHFATKSALAKLIQLDIHGLKFDFASEKLTQVSEGEYNEIESVFRPYMDDDILDVAERLGAGTGSVNMKRYYLLVGPKIFEQEADLSLCHIVEVKQQRTAAPVMHFSQFSPINQLNPAHLTVVAQQRMQRRPDLVLDEVMWRDKHWLVRSRHHAKVGVKPEFLGLSFEPECKGLVTYASVCGKALALAHCRGDRRSMRFEQAVVDILPKHFSDLLGAAKRYADQTITDCVILRSLIEVEQ